MGDRPSPIARLLDRWEDSVSPECSGMAEEVRATLAPVMAAAAAYVDGRPGAYNDVIGSVLDVFTAEQPEPARPAPQEGADRG